MCIGFKYPHFSPSSTCFGLFLVNHVFEDSVQTIINSNLAKSFVRRGIHDQLLQGATRGRHRGQSLAQANILSLAIAVAITIQRGRPRA